MVALPGLPPGSGRGHPPPLTVTRPARSAALSAGHGNRSHGGRCTSGEPGGGCPPRHCRLGREAPRGRLCPRPACHRSSTRPRPTGQPPCCDGSGGSRYETRSPPPRIRDSPGTLSRAGWVQVYRWYDCCNSRQPCQAPASRRARLPRRQPAPAASRTSGSTSVRHTIAPRRDGANG